MDLQKLSVILEVVSSTPTVGKIKVLKLQYLDIILVITNFNFNEICNKNFILKWEKLIIITISLIWLKPKNANFRRLLMSQLSQFTQQNTKFRVNHKF